MKTIIDFHVHVFPDRTHRFVPFFAQAPLAEARKQARAWMRPFTGALHRTQTWLRVVPEVIRRRFEGFGMLAPLPSLLVESTAADLREAMEASGVNYAVAIAHPPWSSNDWILELCQENPKLIPAVNIPAGTAKPGQRLKKYVQQGARILKIHPAADGEGVDSPRYKALLKAATECGIPVILHTGCIHSHLLYKNPMQGEVQKFAPWFGKYRETKFILAHMNFHKPQIALDLAEEYPNLLVDTSWQPPEMIGEASRRLGADRVLFGTDWPLVGNNFDVGISRIRDCVDTGTITQAESELILGGNAARLLQIEAE